MVKILGNIALTKSGIYSKPDISPDVLYLQAVDFNPFGKLNKDVKPYLHFTDSLCKHLLEVGDILFAAKGSNNFAIVFREEMQKAVASSSFIVLRIDPNFHDGIIPEYLAWFLSNTNEFIKLHSQQLGTTIPSISIKDLKKIEIQVPDIATQILVSKIDVLRKRERDLHQQIEKLKNKRIKKGLLTSIRNFNE